jgi:hypothetical protein
MAQLTDELENLRELLEVLREAGVARYTCGSLDVTLGPPPPPAPEAPPLTRQVDRIAAAEKREASANPAAVSPYMNPALWSGGVPPKFPGSSK